MCKLRKDLIIFSIGAKEKKLYCPGTFQAAWANDIKKMEKIQINK